MAEPPIAKSRPSLPLGAKVTLIVTQSIYAILFLPWAMMSAMSVMAFDKPGSEEDPWVWTFVASLWAYPVVAIIGATLSWIFLTRAYRALAIIATLLPALYVLAWFIGFTVAARD